MCFIGQDVTGQKTLIEKYSRVQGDYARIMWSPSTLIPPIFMTTENGLCSEWNDAMQKLSGIRREEAVNKMLLGEVFTSNDSCCRLQDHDTLTKLRIALNAVSSGQDNMEKLLFGFYHRDGRFIEALLSANKRTDMEGKVTGVLCFVQVPSPELQYVLQVQRISEQAMACAVNKMAYLRQQVENPEKAISFLQDFLHSSGLNEEQKQLLSTSVSCREQLAKVISDSDIEGIEDGYYCNLDSCFFFLVGLDWLLFLESSVLILLLFVCLFVDVFKSGMCSWVAANSALRNPWKQL